MDEAEELVQIALGLGALPADIDGYAKLEELQVRLMDRSMDFDGMDDYVSIADAQGLRPDSITIEAWIKPDAFSPAAGIVSKYQFPATPSYALRLSEEPGRDGHLEFTVNDNDGWGNKPNTLVSSSALPLNEWTHVAAVYRADGGLLELYINGELSGSKTGAFMATNTSALTIGRDFSSRYFDGAIDEVKIWGTALTAEQIGNAYAGEPVGAENMLAGYWNFDESTAADASGNSHNGTIFGATPQLNQ